MKTPEALLAELKEVLRDEGEDPKAWISAHLSGSKSMDEGDSDEAEGGLEDTDSGEEDQEADQGKAGKMALAVAAMKKKMSA